MSDPHEPRRPPAPRPAGGPPRTPPERRGPSASPGQQPEGPPRTRPPQRGPGQTRARSGEAPGRGQGQARSRAAEQAAGPRPRPRPPQQPAQGPPRRPAPAGLDPQRRRDAGAEGAAPTATLDRPPPAARDEVVFEEREPRRGRGCLVLGIFLVLVLVAGLAALGLGYRWYQDKVDPPGEPGAPVEITVPEGTSTSALGRLLEEQGVISSASVFQWYLRLNDAPSVQAGVYSMPTGSSMDDVVSILEAGPAAPDTVDLTFPEGQSVFAGEGLPAPGPVVNTMVDGAGFDQATIMQALTTGQVTSRFLPSTPGNMEGLLFPDTYRVEEETTEVALLQQMADRMDQVATEAGIDQAPQTVGLTPYEVLIVASLIERETLVAAERPMVARVIYNRLEANNPLGIDATTQYALGRAPQTTSDFDPNSAYNTRAIQGLPPTPIGIPGRASIEAALNPAEGDWFYYVLQDQEGNHFFTASAAEFEEAKGRCQDLGLC